MMKRYFAVAALLSAICAAQNVPTDQVYDAFKGPYLDSSKWLTLPTCSATAFVDTTASINLLDCARDIQSVPESFSPVQLLGPSGNSQAVS